MLVNMKNLLKEAKKGKYAIAHFNINNLEWTRFILEESQKKNSPVILGVSEGAIKYMGGYKIVVDIVTDLIKELDITIPVVIHLDHGSSLESCKKAIDNGFTSVMIDASKYSINENLEITRKVVEYAHLKDVSVEAEIGSIGGSEDNLSGELKYASVDEAISMASIGIDALAPALGSVHGLYKGEPKLDFEKMREISMKTNLPLVLHGGTGISDELIKKAIDCGICKININTELQIAWSEKVKEYCKTTLEYDPRKIIKSGEISIKEAVSKKLDLFMTK